MRRALASVGHFFGPVRMAQIASGAILYLGAWFGILKVASDRPNIILFSTLLPAASAAVTALWYRVSERRQNWPRPEFGLILGLLFFIPVIFVLTVGSVFGRPPFTLRQALVFLLASYALLPASVADISTYSGLLGPLFLSVVAIYVTGHRMRKRRPDGPRTVGEPAGGLDRGSVGTK